MIDRIIGLENRIFDYIECIYKAEFLGDVQVSISPNCVYTLSLILDNYMAPIEMSFECCSDEEFYQKATKQISQRNFIQVQYFKLILNEGTQERQ